jgi:hypothetical protein
MEPPKIIRYRNKKARLTNKNRKNTVPSNRVENYEPGIHETVMLMNTSTGYNYRNKAKANMKASWNNYMKRHGTKKNTRKTLF